eukprot:CAMPEP_0174262206 /NCGR_PEP_ID=MMETSP0439-20130205/12840_1 /TAXON_ID=0 /ORGANISM="Stereomyxa ramosa, Strain Chinc5" /LENGTH=259 /DNA_ID=CAMNT_0015346877 /DNA_START=401 /DNA_END=1176 /DNA_ORIENTATION=+
MSGVDYVCSAAYIGDKYVMTAGHCVYDNDKDVQQFASAWVFVPAYYDGDAPHGQFPGKSLHVTKGWTSSTGVTMFKYDYAIAIMEKNLEGILGGHLEFYHSINYKNYNYTSYGYPAGSPFNGRWINTCASIVCEVTTFGTLGISCDSTGGSSGGPWTTDTPGFYGLNSYTQIGVDNRMYGPYFDDETDDFVQAVKDGSDDENHVLDNDDDEWYDIFTDDVYLWIGLIVGIIGAGIVVMVCALGLIRLSSRRRRQYVQLA